MPIKIHHGPPGSYKTAGALADDLMREARAGRVIVTNVRGLTRDSVIEQFPDLPESFDVIHVDDKSTEGRQKWATWFHWVPLGAFIFVDEVQDIWPKSWRQSDLDALNYPGGIEQATLDGRPKDWAQAFDKHRHYNWDMTLTTPSYAKVRDDIKGVADMAYKHKNLALIGWTGRYIEGAHAADDTGKNASDFISVQNKKVPSYVFQLYQSTSTGLVSDTKSGSPIWKNPRVALLLGVLGVALYNILSTPLPKVLGGSASVSPLGNLQAGNPPSSQAAASGGAFPAGSGGAVQGNFDPLLEPMADGDPYIVISYKRASGWRYMVSLNNQHLSSDDLLDLGYSIKTLGSCGLQIQREGFRRFITCKLPEQIVAQPEKPPIPAPHSITVPRLEPGSNPDSRVISG